MIIKKFADMHCHFRHDNEAMMMRVIKHTAACCSYALVMPNTKIPTVSSEQIYQGRVRIQKYSGSCKPLMTFKMEANCTPKIVREAYSSGAVAGKLYPEGITTNSHNGITTEMLRNPPENLLDSWEEMERWGMLMLLHGEMPNSFVMDGEKDFLFFVRWLSDNFLDLKVVLEHITTRDAVEMVRNSRNNVAATITYHHLLITLDDVVKYKLVSRNYCKPIAKRPDDRDFLVAAAISGNRKFFLGSDTAPHLLCDKHNHGCAGVYTAPVLAAGLVEFFEKHNSLHTLEAFATNNGPAFYNLQPVTQTMELVKEEWTVPYLIDDIEPFLAGEKLKWRLNETL